MIVLKAVFNILLNNPSLHHSLSSMLGIIEHLPFIEPRITTMPYYRTSGCYDQSNSITLSRVNQQAVYPAVSKLRLGCYNGAEDFGRRKIVYG